LEEGEAGEVAGGGRVEGLLRGLVGSVKSGGFSGDVWRRGGRVLEEWNSRSSWRSVWPRSPWGVVSRWVLLLRWAGGYLCVYVYDDIIASVRHGWATKLREVMRIW